MSYRTGPVNVRATKLVITNTNYQGDAHVFLDEPMTAEELLRYLLDQLVQDDYNRQILPVYRGDTTAIPRLQDEVQKLTAERDALERLLTRRIYQ